MRIERLNPFTPFGWMLVIGTICLNVYACLGSKEQPPQTAAKGRAHVVDDGNGVFYFPDTGTTYRATLRQFYLEHPSLICNYMGATDESFANAFRITGHILHCRDTTVEAQLVTCP